MSETSAETLTLDLDTMTVESVPPIVGDRVERDTQETPEPESTRKGIFSRFRKNDKSNSEKSYPAMPRGGIAAPMAALYRKVGQFIQPFDPGCGTALVMGAEECGKAWEQVAKRNPAVRKWLLALLSTGANMELLIAHIPIFAAVAIHHIPAVRDMVTKLTGDMTTMFEQSMAMTSDA